MLSAVEQDDPPEPDTRLKRKIAAILAADVSGYSRLIAQDEERTLHALAEARQIFDRFVRRGGGRIFNTAGDSVMCEFDSAVEAVRVALRIQEELGRFNEEFSGDRKLQFRIGITIGDVVERGDDLLGDGVNIAARLEGISPPGGICISRSVHEAVANKVQADFQDLGARPLKNIAQPVHAFIVAPPGSASGGAGALIAGERGPAAERVRWSSAPERRRRWRLRTALVVVSVAASLPVLYGVGFVGQGWFGAAQPTVAPAGQIASPVRPPPPPSRSAAQNQNLREKQAQSSAPDKPAGSDKPATVVAERPGSRVSAFAGLANQGLLAEPRTVPEMYHNALMLETKGDREGALRVYAAFAPRMGEMVDPLVRYANLLRNVSGPEAARAAVERLAATEQSRTVTLVRAMLADGADRIAKLETLGSSTQDFSPVAYVLAQALTEKRQGGPTITERRLAFAALDQFLEAAGAGSLAPFFMDRSFLEGWIETARARRGEIEAFFASAQTRPDASFTRVEGGWTAKVTLPEPATAVTARIGEAGAPAAARLAGGTSPHTVAEVAIPATTERTTIYLTYRDLARREAGPFPILFDPAAAAVSSGREALERYPDSWVSFRPDLPDLLSYGQLVANRCAIRRALIGFGDEPPTQAIPLPACGSGLAGDARAIVPLPAGTDAVQVQLTYADGAESAVRMFRRP